MSKQSEKVKLWRQRSKERIVAAMGGKCSLCGYCKCLSALALHHLDPSQKEISFGKIRANPRNWEKVVQELRKCVLLCHNCHSEVHANIIIVPSTCPKFDESFLDYKSKSPCIHY